MPTEQELQAIDKYLEPPESEEPELDEVLTDYFNNTIQDNDGVYKVIHYAPIYGKNNMITGATLVSNILTHDTLTDFLEDETDSYEVIEYLGLGNEYMEEVLINERKRNA